MCLLPESVYVTGVVTKQSCVCVCVCRAPRSTNQSLNKTDEGKKHRQYKS